MQALADPERLGLEGCQLFLSPLHMAAPLLNEKGLESAARAARHVSGESGGVVGVTSGLVLGNSRLRRPPQGATEAL